MPSAAGGGGAGGEGGGPSDDDDDGELNGHDNNPDKDPAGNGGRFPYHWWQRLVQRLLACVGIVGRGTERLLFR